MTGPSGLRPLEHLAERRKCPDTPSKHRYTSAGEAIEAAERRTVEASMPIVAYACPGCGGYHLTKKREGSDVLIPGATVRTRSTARHRHPAQGLPTRNLEVLPIVPGNRAARARMLTDWLSTHPRPSTTEICEAGIVGLTSRTSVSKHMRELGWSVPKGPRGRWRPTSTEAITTAVEARTAEPMPRAEAEVIIARMEHDLGAVGTTWVPFDVERAAQLPLADIIAVLEASGTPWRFQVGR